MAIEPAPKVPIVGPGGFIAPEWVRYFELISANVDPTPGSVTSYNGRSGAVLPVSGDYDHSEIGSVGTDDHHAEGHDIDSHDDTTATGAELEELTDGSETALHTHTGPSIATGVGSPTVDTLQEYIDNTGSSGFFLGGTITDGGSGTIDVAAGSGFIRTTNNNNAELQSFKWSASAGIAVASDTVQYVYVDDSGTISLSTDEFAETPDKIQIGVAVNEGGAIHHAISLGVKLDESIGQAGRFIRRVHGIVRDKRRGGLLVGETGTRNMTLSAGVLWWGRTEYTIPAIDTSVSGGFDTYSAGGQEATDATQWPNTQYDNAGTLTTMTNNRWAVLWFYIEPDGCLVMVYGRNQYTSEADAEDELSPSSSMPVRLSATSVLAAKLVFQKSAATAATIFSAFETQFSSSGITDHGNLAGLADDDHTQYFLADGTRALSGPLELSGDISPAQITAQQDDYNPTGLSGAAVLRLNSDASQDITGLDGGADGRIMLIRNVGSFDIVLKDEDANSTAANRFALTADVTLEADSLVFALYDSTSSRWGVVAGGGGAGLFELDTEIQPIIPSDLHALGHKFKAMVSDGGATIPQSDFVDADVDDVTNDDITLTGHGWKTAQKVRLLSTGTLPGGLAVATDYYVIKDDANTIRLATSVANAQAGTEIDITSSAGGGTHSVVPPKGTAFLHEPTGRSIYYLYNGIDWPSSAQALIGDMAVYVDTGGADDANGGTASGASAFASIIFATSMIPGMRSGNVTVNLANQTFTEADIFTQGKARSGPFTIEYLGLHTSQGTTNNCTVSVGSGATKGTVTAPSGTPFGSFDNMWVYFETDKEYRIIDSDTTTVLTLVHYAPSATAQNVTVYSSGTTIDGTGGTGCFRGSAQQGLIYTNLKCTGATYSWWLIDFCEAVFNRIESTERLLINKGTVATMFYCLQSGSAYFGIWADSAVITALGCKLTGSATFGVFSSTNGVVSWTWSCVVDGATTAQWATAGSVIDNQNSYIDIRNATTGMLADLTGKIIRNANATFTTVTTPKSPAGATNPTYVE